MYEVLIYSGKQALHINGIEFAEYADVEGLDEVLSAQIVVFKHSPKILVVDLRDSRERSQEISCMHFDCWNA